MLTSGLPLSMRRTLGERLLGWRDGLLGRPSIQTLSVAIPFLRSVANRRARELFDLCTGFVHTQVITACVELDLFELLGREPMAPDRVAQHVGIEADPAARLLAAAAAMKLFVRMRDGRYRLGELGAAFRGAPGIKEIVRHNRMFYRDLADPVALLRGQKADLELPRYWPYAEGSEDVSALSSESTTPYSRFMAATQPFIVQDVLAAYSFGKHRALLDVGGGDGTFASTIAEATPRLRVGVVDLPSVAELADQQFQRRGLSSRATAHSGDFHRSPIPDGYDAISLVRILLDHDDATVLRLLKRIRQALPPGGTILIAELMSGAKGAETISDAYFGFYLMAMGRGRPRSETEITRLLTEAGFENVRSVSTRRALMTQLIVAQRPLSERHRKS